MHLDAWIREQGYGAISRLSRMTGLAYGTVFAATKRRTRITYASAALIAKATKGQVSIDELCTAQRMVARQKRKRAA